MIRALLTALPISAGTVWAEEAGRPLPKPGNTVDLFQWSLAMVAVLAAILLLAWLMRRLGSFSQLQSGRFRVLAALSVGPRERVILLQAGDKQLVLGVAPGRVQALCVLEGKDLIEGRTEDTAASSAPGFSQRLNELLPRRHP